MPVKSTLIYLVDLITEWIYETRYISIPSFMLPIVICTYTSTYCTNHKSCKGVKHDPNNFKTITIWIKKPYGIHHTNHDERQMLWNLVMPNIQYEVNRNTTVPQKKEDVIMRSLLHKQLEKKVLLTFN